MNMLEFFIDLLKQSHEWQHWGLNVATFSSVSITVLALFEAWGLRNQIRTIWKEESGESVSVLLFSYRTGYYSLFLPFGIYAGSIVISLNSLLAIFCAVIVYGLSKYKSWTLYEKVIAGVAPLMPIAMILLPWKDAMYVGFSMVLLGTALWQVVELYRAKSPGALDIRLLSIYVFASFVWLVFAYVVGNVGLMITTPIAFSTMLATALLWVYYFYQEKSASKLEVSDTAEGGK